MVGSPLQASCGRTLDKETPRPISDTADSDGLQVRQVDGNDLKLALDLVRYSIMCPTRKKKCWGLCQDNT